MKQKSFHSLKVKLWDLVKVHIKERDRKLRRGKCMTCPRRPAPGIDSQCGHGIAKSVCGVVLYHHPDNLFLQCSRCNGAGLGEGAVWRGVIGEEKYKELEKIRKDKKNVQWDRRILEGLIDCLLHDPYNYVLVHEELYGY